MIQKWEIAILGEKNYLIVGGKRINVCGALVEDTGGNLK